MPIPFPAEGRLAAIDYGHVRIGIAVCDPQRTIASPLVTYVRRTPSADAAYFRRLTDQEQLVGFVVGLPVHMSAAESQKSQEARQFGQWLARETCRPVCYCDERFTTLEAKGLLALQNLRKRKRRGRLDMLAAQLILTTFLESPQTADSPPQPLDDSQQATPTDVGDFGEHL